MRSLKTCLLLLLLLAGSAFPGSFSNVPFDTYSGYFVSNKFEPDASVSFVMIRDQAQFDRIFGTAFVMRDKSHRLLPGIFKSHTILAVIHRGNAMCEYGMEEATVKDGTAELHYSVTFNNKSDTATYACPLIVSITKGDYKSVRFVENGKVEKTIHAMK